MYVHATHFVSGLKPRLDQMITAWVLYYVPLTRMWGGISDWPTNRGFTTWLLGELHRVVHPNFPITDKGFSFSKVICISISNKGLGQLIKTNLSSWDFTQPWDHWLGHVGGSEALCNLWTGQWKHMLPWALQVSRWPHWRFLSLTLREEWGQKAQMPIYFPIIQPLLVLSLWLLTPPILHLLKGLIPGWKSQIDYFRSANYENNFICPSQCLLDKVKWTKVVLNKSNKSTL